MGLWHRRLPPAIKLHHEPVEVRVSHISRKTSEIWGTLWVFSGIDPRDRYRTTEFREKRDEAHPELFAD
jgi:hypothetical protein